MSDQTLPSVSSPAPVWFFGRQPIESAGGQLVHVVWVGGGTKFSPADPFFFVSKDPSRCTELVTSFDGGLTTTDFAGIGDSTPRASLPPYSSPPYSGGYLVSHVAGAGVRLPSYPGLGFMLHDIDYANNTTTLLPRFAIGDPEDARSQITVPIWVAESELAAGPIYFKEGGVGYRIDKVDSPATTSPTGSVTTRAALTTCTDCGDASVESCWASKLGAVLNALGPAGRAAVSSCWLEAFVYALRGPTYGGSVDLGDDGTFSYGGRTYVYRKTATANTTGLPCPCPGGGGHQYLVWVGGYYRARRCDGVTTGGAVWVYNRYAPFFFTYSGATWYADPATSSSSAPGGTIATDSLGYPVSGVVEVAACP